MILEKLEELLEEFDLANSDLREALLLEYGNKFTTVPSDVASPPYSSGCKVPSCASEAYCFTKERNDGTLDFYFAVVNPQGISAKALAQILTETVSGAPLTEIAGINDQLVFRIFGKGLSLAKGLGLRSMVQMVVGIARKKLNQ